MRAAQGHWSPIVRQMRGSSKPDGMCLVVGGCASGFPAEGNRFRSTPS
jgi:lycopene cyclase CruP